jgi:hypothetical protein
MLRIAMTAAAICLVSLSLCQNATAQKESYSAIMVTRAPSTQHVRFTFNITKWATEDEIKQLGKVLKERGQDALFDELKKLDAGHINASGDIGNQIAIAEKSMSGNNTVITMINARRMSTVEQARNATHTDYPFGFLQVTLNEKGEGTGKMVMAAKIKYDTSKGHSVLEPYGNGAAQVTNVEPLK